MIYFVVGIILGVILLPWICAGFFIITEIRTDVRRRRAIRRAEREQAAAVAKGGASDDGEYRVAGHSDNGG